MENIIVQWEIFKEKLMYLGYWDKLLNHLETIVMIILLGVLLFALMNCFLGHQLMRLWMTVIGLAVGGCFGGYMGLRQFYDKNAIFLTATICAFAVAIAATLVYRVGLIVLCGGVVFATLELLFPVSSMSVHMGFLALALVAGIASFERETVVVTWITGVCGGLAAAKAGFLLLHWPSTVIAILVGAALAALGIKYQYSQIRKNPPKPRKRKH
ncbi:MAG: hypothetical protein HFH60_11030 [Lachnospiraceae bacterium]|nr:hypothetical protein [Lachnospiraceae bacterium]